MRLQKIILQGKEKPTNNNNNSTFVNKKSPQPSPQDEMDIEKDTPITLFFAGKGNWWVAYDEVTGMKLRTSGPDVFIGLGNALKQLPPNYQPVHVYTISDELFNSNPEHSPSPDIRRRVTRVSKTRQDDKSFLAALAECVPPHPREILAADWYTESTAILIGINNYPKCQKLDYCIADVNLMEQCLTKLGFNITCLRDQQATKQAIQAVIFDNAKRHKNGRLLIFFAGHGDQTLQSILPYDYNPDKPYSTSLPMHDFGHNLASVVPKHTLRILDCCYSSYGARERGNKKGDLMNHLQKSAFELMAAGQSDQTAKEMDGHGVFTKILVEGLEGAAYKTQDNWITSSELTEFIRERIEEKHNQTPQFWRSFGNREEADGMFIFEHPNSNK